nr:DsbA family protein [Halomonas populi]
MPGLQPCCQNAGSLRLESLCGRRTWIEFPGGVELRANNTFAAHRVLAWAATQNQETALQLALFDAYFGEAKNPSDPEVLREKAIEVGLDGDTAEAIVRSDQYANDARAAEQRFMEAGVNAVPGIILDGRYLISGAQPPEVLVDALCQLAEENANR